MGEARLKHLSALSTGKKTKFQWLAPHLHHVNLVICTLWDLDVWNVSFATGLGNLIYRIYFSILIRTHSRVLLIKDSTWFEQNYISTFPA
jgi:hypothetical protein